MMTTQEMNRLADITAQRMMVIDSAMTVTQCAEYLGRSPAAVHKLAQRGQIPVHRKNRRIYFFKNEINNFLKHD